MRRFLRAPGFVVITLITLAVGTGATTAIFTIVNGVLLKPLAYPDPDRLVGVWLTAPGVRIQDLNASPASYLTFREENRSFQDVGLWSRGSESVTGVAEPEQVESLSVTDGVLPILGVRPALGRWFTPEEDTPKGPETVMLGYGYWQRRFGGNRSVLGTKLLVNGRPREVIGVMPADFRMMSFQPAVILPLRFNRGEVHLGNFSFQGIARLKPGTTLSQASADIARMLPIMFGRFPAPGGLSKKAFEEAGIAPNLRMLKQDVVGNVGEVLWTLMATVGIVLFIACANVANLLLVRADGRQQELAVRAALGASPGQIARDLLAESVTLGLIGGALGLGIAYGALRLLVHVAPAGLPRLDEIAIDPVVLAFAVVTSLAASLLFGMVPVLKHWRPQLGTALRTGGRTYSESRDRHRTRSTLVVVQVSLALVLLIGAGLMIRTLQSLRGVHPGFTRPQEILTMRVSIPSAHVPDLKRVARMHQDIADKLAGIPGVTSVGLSNSITMDGGNNNDPIVAEDQNYTESQIPPIRRFKHVSPGFFRTMGNPILAGRDFTWTEIYELRPVVIISESLARELWGKPEAALRKRIRESPKGVWREIVGVVGNERDDGPDKKATTAVYWPFLKGPFWVMQVDVRRTMAYAIRSSRTGSEDFLKEVRQAVWAVNPNLPLANVRTVQEIYQRSMARSSFTLVVLAIAAGMALLLGVVGIYGVISYSISQRTREIGIRIALGAPREKVSGLFVRDGLLLSGIGVACGVAAAVPLTRLMTTLLFEVRPLDPMTYLVVAGLLLGAALLASYLPARRATRVDPIEALRAE
jgi:predicted permease